MQVMAHRNCADGCAGPIRRYIEMGPLQSMPRPTGSKDMKSSADLARLIEAVAAERDHQDSTREVAPLLQAEDAVELITDGLAIEEVITTLVDLFRERIPEEAWPAPEGGAAA